MILKKNYLSVYAKSFNWAGFFLPKQTYNECSALYNFCRIMDNIADEKDTLVNKREKFTKFKEDFYSKKFSDDIIQDMWNLVDKYNISLNIINDLFDGIERRSVNLISSPVNDVAVLTRNEKEEVLLLNNSE